MKERRTINRKSILYKYSSSYRIALLVALAVVLGSFIMCALVVSRFLIAEERMIAVSEMEQSFTNVNDNVNMAYLFLSQDGITEYEVNQPDVIARADSVEELAKRAFSRELFDLTNTIRSYVEESDKLISDINAYINIPRGESKFEHLSQEYDALQQTYSYVMLRFQESYSGLLNTLHQQEVHTQLKLAVILLVFSLIFLITLLSAQKYLHKIYTEFSGSMSSLLAGIRGMKEDFIHSKPIELKTDDEFEILADAFNQMQSMIQNQQKKSAEMADIKARLSETENENLRMYAALQKNHLDFLQSRINPHFLFNTLNMISAQAQIEDAPKSSELMETTAAFLRYNLDNISKTVTLAQEIGNLEDYISIQKCRYEDRYSYVFETDQSCLDHCMPCMVLQPLVENSIQHGMGMMLSGGMIIVIARRENGYITFGVSDNGVGMTGEQIEAISRNLRENTTTSSHIGLRNIYMRLKLFYHDDVKLTMESNEPGTTILFTVPYTGGEE